MTIRYTWLALCLFPVALSAQGPTVTTPPALAMDQESHHHLVLKNDVVKVFEIDFPSHDAMLSHQHDRDEISIVVGGAATVSTTAGQADILTMSKVGDVRFDRSGRVHSVRNIGPTTYHSVSINLLSVQTGARNLCGNQIPAAKPNCPALPVPADQPRADLPQFETDQVRVTLTRIRPRQQATFGEPDRDNLIVAIDETAIAPASGKGSDQTLAPGSPVWIARGSMGRILRNNSDGEARVVTVAFKP